MELWVFIIVIFILLSTFVFLTIKEVEEERIEKEKKFKCSKCEEELSMAFIYKNKMYCGTCYYKKTRNKS